MATTEPISNGQIPTTYSECSKQGLITTFAMILGDEPVYTGSQESGPSDCVVGIISIISDLPVSLMLGLPHETAVQIAKTFAGFDIPIDSDDMGDVVGELVNILAGDVSAKLDVAGIKADISLPTVVRGSDVDLLSPNGFPSVKMHFNCQQGSFWLKVEMGKLN